MAGYFFVTGMTAIEFPEGVQWDEYAKPVFTGPCAELLPVMIDHYPTSVEEGMWSEQLSPNDCYRFMLTWPFDFILGGGTRPARREDTESLDSILRNLTGPATDLMPATFDFSFLSPDGKELLNLHDCLWNEQVEPEGGGELVSARALEEWGYKQLSGPHFWYDTKTRFWHETDVEE